MNNDKSRYIALKMACLHAEDRQWLLMHLEPEARKRIQALLADLEASGLQMDAGVVAEICAERSRSAQQEAAHPDAAVNPAVDSVLLQTVTRQDPAWAALTLLAADEARRKAVLRHLPGEQALAIHACLNQLPAELPASLKEHFVMLSRQEALS